MSHDYNKGKAPGMRVVNLEALVPSAQPAVLGPARDERGFPSYLEIPRVLLDAKLGRRERDLEQCHEYWLLSARLKTVFEAVEPAGFAFQRCETVLADGQAGPEHWLCDVLPMLDAVDEESSTVQVVQPPTGRRYYKFLSNTSLIFRPEIVADHHIFRLAYRPPEIICDDVLMEACKAARMDGIYFQKAMTTTN